MGTIDDRIAAGIPEAKDPRFRALQGEIRGTNLRLDALINLLKPKPFVMDPWSKSKAGSFTDTEVICPGADLIQISTDGDQLNLSYKVVHLDGSKSESMEASESPHVLGPITAILLTNDTAEANKTVRVARYQASQAALSAILHGTPLAVSVSDSERMYFAEIEEYASGGSNYFETDQAMGTTPTLAFVGSPLARHLLIHTIKYSITPANAVTYQLYLLERKSADDQEQKADIFFDSGNLQVSGTPYCVVAGGSPSKLPILVNLETIGEIIYMVDWTAAPGNSKGYIRIYGVVLA